MIRLGSENRFKTAERFRLTTTSSHFVVKESIGEGQFGSVRRAIHKNSKKTMALKIMTVSDVEAEYISEEIRIQGTLKHPNILSLKGFFEEKGRVFVVLPYADRGDLRSLLKQKGTLNESEAAKFVFQLSNALSFCHDKNIIHRDVKPENAVLFGDKLDLKLSDFGCSIESVKPRSTFLGTPLYLSPELLSDDRSYSCAIDNWSVGVVTFELVGGYTPFEDRHNPISAIDHILAARYKVPAHFSLPLASLVRLLLLRDPAKRLTSAAVLEHPWVQQSLKKDDNLVVRSNKSLSLFFHKVFGFSNDEKVAKIRDDLESIPSVLETKLYLAKMNLGPVSLETAYKLCRLMGETD